MTLRKKALAALLCAAPLAVAGCGGSNDDSKGSTGSSANASEYAVDASVTIAMGSDPGKLDPHMNVNPSAVRLFAFVYDTLLELREDGSMGSRLAERWSNTARSVTFTLRDGVTCSDGSPLTAETVAANLDYLKSPDVASQWVGIAVPADRQYTVRADAASRTVRVTTARPNSFLLRMIGTRLYIVCDRGIANRGSLAQGAAGSGPYVLDGSTPGDRYSVKRRDGYAWGPDGTRNDEPGMPASVDFKVVADETTAANLLLSGGLTIAAFGGVERDRLDGEDLVERVVPYRPALVSFNQGGGRPGSDPAVRSALTGALDRAEMTEVVGGGRGAPLRNLETLEPSGCPTNTIAEVPMDGDVEGAKTALQEAGWSGGETLAKDGKPLALRLIFASDAGDGVTSAAELMAQQWRAAGADVTLAGLPQAQLGQTLFGTSNWDAALLGVAVDLPSAWQPLLTGPSPARRGLNFSSVDNADYARLTAEAITTTGEPGCELWQQAESAIAEAHDLIPVAATTTTFYGKRTEFEVLLGDAIVPLSIRVLK